MMNPMQRRLAPKHVFGKTAILLLLLAVINVSAFAKHAQFLPESDPIHYLSSATKMNVDHSPVIIGLAQTGRITNFVPPRPELRSISVIPSQKVAITEISVIVSLQHRSPPSAFLS
jgi:hypothetical protein